MGNCTVYPIEKTSFGAKQVRSTVKTNAGYMLDIQNPLELFYLDQGFTYVGEVSVENLKKEALMQGQNCSIETILIDIRLPTNLSDKSMVTPLALLKRHIQVIFLYVHMLN